MRYLLVIWLILWVQGSLGQRLADLDGRWAFTGFRTTLMKVDGEKVYIAMINYADTLNFSRFLRAEPLDSSIFFPANLSVGNDTILIEADFPQIDHHLRLLYLANDNNYILYTGDVFFDSSAIIASNRNCNTGIQVCHNRLYYKDDLNSILRLKNADVFSRDDAFEFLLRLNEKFKVTCNRCYAGFTDAYMNEILITMGFNPITRPTAFKSVWYNTSGFTMFLRIKFQDDERIVQLTKFVFDNYLRQ